jgi:hypothetical protein
MIQGGSDNKAGKDWWREISIVILPFEKRVAAIGARISHPAANQTSTTLEPKFGIS